MHDDKTVSQLLDEMQQKPVNENAGKYQSKDFDAFRKAFEQKTGLGLNFQVNSSGKSATFVVWSAKGAFHLGQFMISADSDGEPNIRGVSGAFDPSSINKNFKQLFTKLLDEVPAIGD